MRILLFDSSANYPANPLFAEALDELAAQKGYSGTFVDEANFIGAPGLSRRILRRIARVRASGFHSVNAELVNAARYFHPDVLLVVKGSNLSANTLRTIKHETGAVTINYATDDPFNPTNSSGDLVASISEYDIWACTKRAVIHDLNRAGARAVSYIPFGYKPLVHYPERPSYRESAKFQADVIFLGGCDSDRAPVIEYLVKTIPQLQLHLYGGYWARTRSLRRYSKGVAYGRDFRLAVSSAKIVLNLVRRANRDDHVMRTFELPACRAFTLAERTNEQMEFFREGKEAAYFGSPEEMVDKVRYYLEHESDRERIAEAGYRRVTSEKHTYKDRLIEICRLLDQS
jgi:glycosyltransferase involved in cell wall biosynthesis